MDFLLKIVFGLCTPFMFILTMIITTEFLNKNKIPVVVLVAWVSSIIGGISQAKNAGHFFIIFVLLIVGVLIPLKFSR